MTVARVHVIYVTLALTEIGMFAAAGDRLPQRAKSACAPRPRRDAAWPGGQMPAMGHTLKNVRRERSLLHMPWVSAYADGKSSRGNRADSLIVRAGQKLGITEIDDGIRLASFVQHDLSNIDPEQSTLQTIDNPFGTRLSPMS